MATTSADPLLIFTVVMSGALFFHLTRLGIEVRGDHGQLFIYALLVFVCCLILVWSFRKQLVHYFA